MSGGGAIGMTRGYSRYLDAVRGFAALVVLVSHLGFYWVSGGSLQWIRDLNLGSDFVIVFFVLSGVVIAHTSRVKDKTLGNFATARLSRLYSVAIPAIALSYAAWAIMSTYPGAEAETRDFAREIFASLTFTNYVWFSEARLPTNGPFWSVAYEFWYYALFGVWTFLKGRARLCGLAAILLIVGVQVLLLLPCWLLGVYVYRCVTSGSSPVQDRRRAWVWTLAPLVIYAIALAAHLPLFLKGLTTMALFGASPYAVLHFSDEFLWNTIIAGLVAMHFIGAATLTGERTPAESVKKTVRWWSARTFSLYLFHMPVLHIIARHPSFDASNPAHTIACGIIVVASCLLLAELTERRLDWMRDKAARLRSVVANAAVQGRAKEA